jgi:hypothetical protein
MVAVGLGLLGTGMAAALVGVGWLDVRTEAPEAIGTFLSMVALTSLFFTLRARCQCAAAPVPRAGATAAGSGLALLAAPALTLLLAFLAAAFGKPLSLTVVILSLIAVALLGELLFVLHLRALAVWLGDAPLARTTLVYFAGATALVGVMCALTIMTHDASPPGTMAALLRPLAGPPGWCVSWALVFSWRFLVLYHVRRLVMRALEHMPEDSGDDLADEGSGPGGGESLDDD